MPMFAVAPSSFTNGWKRRREELFPKDRPFGFAAIAMPGTWVPLPASTDASPFRSATSTKPSSVIQFTILSGLLYRWRRHLEVPTCRVYHGTYPRAGHRGISGRTSARCRHDRRCSGFDPSRDEEVGCALMEGLGQGAAGGSKADHSARPKVLAPFPIRAGSDRAIVRNPAVATPLYVIAIARR
jgi:hypothetical protein